MAKRRRGARVTPRRQPRAHTLRLTSIPPGNKSCPCTLSCTHSRCSARAMASSPGHRRGWQWRGCAASQSCPQASPGQLLSSRGHPPRLLLLRWLMGPQVGREGPSGPAPCYTEPTMQEEQKAGPCVFNMPLHAWQATQDNRGSPPQHTSAHTIPHPCACTIPCQVQTRLAAATPQEPTCSPVSSLQEGGTAPVR